MEDINIVVQLCVALSADHPCLLGSGSHQGGLGDFQGS